MKILIVDDNEAARKLLKIRFSRYGDLKMVNGGAEAITAFKEAFKTDERFDLICLDYCMPNMDGIEVLKAIRQIESEHQVAWDNHVRILMVSASDCESAVTKAYAYGCDSFMLRPFRKEQIIEEASSLGLSL